MSTDQEISLFGKVHADKVKQADRVRGTRVIRQFIRSDGATKIFPVFVDGRDIYCTPGTRAALDAFYSGSVVDDEVADSNYREEATFILPTVDIYSNFRGTATRLDVVPIIDRSDRVRLNITNLFAILGHFPTLRDVYRDYLADPDEGIIVQEKDLSPPPIKCLDLDAVKPKHSKAFMRAASGCLLLLMVKTIDRDATDHMSEFIKRRVNAISHLLGSTGRAVVPSEVQAYYGPSIDMLGEVLSFFPKIKQAVFIQVINSEGPLPSHVRDLMKGTQLTTITMIHEFLSTEEPTMLHIHRPVAVDAQNFLRVWLEMQKKYGANWVYFKLIDPQGTATSTRQLEVIGSAAYSWAMVTKGQESLGRLKSMRHNSSYAAMAKQLLPPGLRTNVQASIAEMLNDLQKSGFMQSVKSGVCINEDGEPYIPE